MTLIVLKPQFRRLRSAEFPVGTSHLTEIPGVEPLGETAFHNMPEAS